MIVARFNVRCVPEKTEEMVEVMRAVVARVALCQT